MRDDLISRQAAIELIKNNSYTIIHNLNDVEKGMTLYGIIQALEYLPSVQPKTGHWICDYKGDHVADYHCSECGRQLGFAFSTQNKKILGGRWKYCDVCGAKMKGETE